MEWKTGFVAKIIRQLSCHNIWIVGEVEEQACSSYSR